MYRHSPVKDGVALVFLSAEEGLKDVMEISIVWLACVPLASIGQEGSELWFQIGADLFCGYVVTFPERFLNIVVLPWQALLEVDCEIGQTLKIVELGAPYKSSAAIRLEYGVKLPLP